MANKQSFWIPGPMPGLNELLDSKSRKGSANRRGQRWTKYNNTKSEWTTVLLSLLQTNGISPVDKIDIELHYFEQIKKGRKRDPDNIYSGTVKLLLDSLVSHGVIPDDSAKHVGWLIFAPVEYVRENPGIQVILRRFDGSQRQASEQGKTAGS